MDMFDKMLVDYSQGSGSAMEEASKSANNLQGRINALSNSWTEFVNSVVQSDTLKTGVNILNELVQGVTKLTSSLGSLGTIGLGAGLLASFKGAGIFKTFDSNIDKISAKWGIFGKSFNDIGNAIVGRIKDINKGFQSTDDLIGSIKNSDSVWKRLYPSKEAIKSQMIDVNALYPEKTDAQFTKLLSKLTQQQNTINTTKGSWNDYFKNLGEGEKWQIEFVQNTDLQKASLYDVKKAYDASRDGAIAHNAALKQQTLSAKAGQVALKGLAMAGNMIAMWAISKGIELLVDTIDEYIHAAEIAREKSSELTDAWNEESSLINDSIAQYDELKKKLSDSSLSTADVKSAKEDLLNIQNDLVDKYGQEALGIDLVNGKYDEQIAKLKELSIKKANEYTAKNYSNIKSDREYVNEAVNLNSDLGYYTNTIKPDFNKAIGFDIQKYLKKYDKLGIKVKDSNSQVGVTGQIKLVTSGTREEIYDQITNLFNDLANDFGESNEGVNNFKDSLSNILGESFDTEQIEKSKNNIKKYAEAEILSKNETRKLYEDSVDAVEKYNEAVANGKGVEEAKKHLESVRTEVYQTTSGMSGAKAVFDDIYAGMKEVGEETKDTVGEFTNISSTFNDFWSSIGDTEKATELKEELFKLASTGELTGSKLKSLAESNELLKSAMDSSGLSADKLAEKIRELNIDNIESDIKSFADALDKVKNKQSLTAEETSKLILADNSLAGSVKKTKDGYLIEKDALSKVIDTQKEKYNVAVSYEINETKNTIDRISERIKAYQKEIEALKEVSKARDDLGGTTSGSYSDTLAQLELEKKRDKDKKKLKASNKKLKELESSLNNIDTSSSSKSSGSNSKSKSSKQEIDWLSRRLTRMQSIIDLTATKLKNLFKIDEKENNINKQIKQTTKLINQYGHAYKVYIEKFNKSTKASGKGKKRVPALSRDIINKITSGEYTDESYSRLVKKYGKKRADKINNAIDYYDKAQDSLKNKEEQIANTHQLKKDKIQLRIDDAQSKIYRADARIENATSASDKNKILDNEKKYYNELYKQKIKQAELDEDSVEVERLKAEQKKQERDLSIEQHQNNIDEKQSALDVLEAQKENVTSASEKNAIIDQELALKREICNEELAIAELNGDQNEQERLKKQLLFEEKKAQLEQIANTKDEFDLKKNALSRDEAKLQQQIAENEAKGIGQSVKDYKEQISLSKERQKQLREEKAYWESQLAEQLDSKKIIADETDPAYKELMDTIASCDEGISQCTVDQINWNKAIKEMDYKNYEALLDLLDMAYKKLENLKSIREAHGKELTNDEILKQIEIDDKIINSSKTAMESAKKNLSDAFKEGEYGFTLNSEQIDEFMDYLEYMPEQIPDLMKEFGIENFNKETYKGAFDEINKFTTANDSWVQALVDAEGLSDEIGQKVINHANEDLEALKKQKDYKDRIFAIEKAQYDLEKAKNNLTKKVWDGQQWVYTADTEAVQSAQESLDNAKFDEFNNSIQDLIDVLEQFIKDFNIYDDNGNMINKPEIVLKKGVLGEYTIADIDKIFTDKVLDTSKLSGLMSNIQYAMPNVSIPNINLPDIKSRAMNQTVNYDKIELILPNITDASTGADLAKSFVNELKNLPSYAKQYDWNK